MVARQFDRLDLMFAREAQLALEGLSPEARDRAIRACEELAELAAVAPLATTPAHLPALASLTDEFEIMYEVSAANRALLVRQVVHRR